MTGRIALHALSLAMTVAGCALLPYWGIRALWPVLEHTAPSMPNYRGRRVTYGLGLVVLLWAGGAFAAGALQNLIVEVVRSSTTDADPLRWVLLLNSWPARTVGAVALVTCAFGFGLIDDLFGDRSDRGFRGHVGALMAGRLTTGALKLVGIGAASAFAASNVVNSTYSEQTGALPPGWQQGAAWIGTWILATMVIALTANLVNLMDLRPGRALKVYLLLAVAGMLGMRADGLFDSLVTRTEFLGTALPHPWIDWIAGTLSGLAFATGPAIAAWKLDVTERSMLGDAGANALGALAGFLLASSLPIPGLAIAATLLLVLNLASERVSFSEVVERSRVLMWLDGLGRVRDIEEGSAGVSPDGGGAGPR